MIVPEFNVDRVAWNTALKKFWAYSNKSIEDITRAQARLLCVELSRQTQPFGDGEDARAKGVARTSGDIKKVFIPQDSLQAWGLNNYRRARGRLYDWLTRALADGKLADAQKAMDRLMGRTFPIIQTADASLHKSQRNNKGTIGRRPKRWVVADGASVQRFIDSKEKLVGFGKSGWAQAARDLGGTRGIPGWVSRNRGPGGAEDRMKSKDKNIVLRNDVKYASDIITQQQIDKAFVIQGEKMDKAIDHALAYEAGRTIAA